jgi:FMN-dependent NADH-azoreductase
VQRRLRGCGGLTTLREFLTADYSRSRGPGPPGLPLPETLDQYIDQRPDLAGNSLIAEVRAADIVVIGAPMYNFNITTGLRAWFDHVLRAGESFSYRDAGPKGLLEGKRVIVITSRGGLYSEGPGQASDFQEPYLRHLLGFVGITDITFVHAERTGFGPEVRAAAIVAAQARIAALAGGPIADAA